MKVIPSQIEFTLPSPKLGIESIPVIDPPWTPKTKTKINSTIHEKGQVDILMRKNNVHIFSPTVLYVLQDFFEFGQNGAEGLL